MDMITESLLGEFSTQQEITSLPKDQRFEHFTSYLALKRHYGETFDTQDIVTGQGGDTGIDGFAAIVNAALIQDVAQFEELDSTATYLDVVFVFVQAEQTAGFDGAKIGNFGFGVTDFFAAEPKLKRNDQIKESAALMRAIYQKSSKFKRGNPACRLYYMTTGKWQNDQNLEARRAAVIADLNNLGLFSTVEFHPVGAEGLQKLYRQAKNAISREFTFANKAVVPEISGITDAYVGLVSAEELLKVIRDEDGEITKSIFYDNVRDWQEFNEVNSEIRETLKGPTPARFALMNNGVTIITRHLQPTGNRFNIEDFQIVNGCQTSHVLFEVARDGAIDPSVMVPLRVIATQDEEVINAIIRATNRQTQVKEEQFFALTEFPKQLEQFFVSFPDQRRLYYERRSRQYESAPIEKTRVVTQVNLTKAFAAMFLNDPHSVTRRYKGILAKVGTDIFGPSHKLDPYYVSAFALYKLEFLFRTHKIESKYKQARYHILMALRLLLNPDNLPQMNSWAMVDYCQKLNETLWDVAKADEAFTHTLEVIDAAASGSYDSDTIRTHQFTQKVIAALTPKKGSK